MFQLDQLGTAVLSPIGAAVKNEQQAICPGKVSQRANAAVLIRECK
jgi:hypothetical protein